MIYTYIRLEQSGCSMVEYFQESPSWLGMWLVELLPTVNEGLGSIPRTRGKGGRKELSIIAVFPEDHKEASLPGESGRDESCGVGWRL